MATLQPGEKARMYALGKIMRGGASRGGYVSGQVFIRIDGIDYGFGRASAAGVLIDSLTITDELDDTPNTCTFRLNGVVATAGSEIAVTLGSKNSGTKLFAGFALTTDQIYVGDKPANVQTGVQCVDYTWLFAFPKATKHYRNLSATDIARDLVDTYAASNGFTSVAAPNLPVLDEITYTNEDLDAAMTRLARRIGGYWYVDYNKGVHLFFDESAQLPPPEPLTPTHRSLADLRKTAERTQVLTRVFVEGRGTALLGPVAAGDNRIPLDSSAMFDPPAADVSAKVAEGNAQLLTYTGVVRGSGGALVGPGVGPSTAPALSLAAGTGIESGTHRYGVTYVTGTGESLLSPIAEIITGQPLPNPTVPPVGPTNNPTGSPYDGSFIPIGDTVAFAYAYSTVPVNMGLDPTLSVTLSTTASPSTVTISNNDPLNPNMSAPIYIRTPSSSDPRVQSILLWMSSAANGGKWGYFRSGANTPGFDVVHHSKGGGYPVYDTGSPDYRPLPPANTTGTDKRVTVSQIPTHATTAVTARKLYRTAANATTPLKLLTTIADNTTTTYADSTPDASLGAAAPVADTSGLQPAGQVPAGSTDLIVSGGAPPFEATGGWAVLGNGEQVIRYQSVAGGKLLGLPATGIGSLTSTIAYNTSVTASPMLTGVAGITEPLVRGDEVYLVVTREDADRASALAAMVHIGSGRRDEWVQDRRLSITEARARALATLAMRPLEDVTLTYRCRDLRTAAGRNITANLGAPTNIAGTFKIQRVTIDRFRPLPTQYPTFTVTASTRGFNFEDWLRRMRTAE
jgi:hypothetical protein